MKTLPKLDTKSRLLFMTRINLVDPSELMDQHLFAEFREIKMVPKALRRSLKAKQYNHDLVLKSVPKQFTLNTGHVKFFYDKGLYLSKRFTLLQIELIKRGYKIDLKSSLDDENIYLNVPSSFLNDYTPTEEALSIIRKRIQEKIDMKPSWYRKTIPVK